MPVFTSKPQETQSQRIFFLSSSINRVFYFQVFLVLKTDLPSPLGKKENKAKQTPEHSCGD